MSKNKYIDDEKCKLCVDIERLEEQIGVSKQETRFLENEIKKIRAKHNWCVKCGVALGKGHPSIGVETEMGFVCEACVNSIKRQYEKMVNSPKGGGKNEKANPV